MSGLLKTRLFELEKKAETLEKIVYNYLVELDFVSGWNVSSYEEKILRKLRALDDVQDEIDAVKAKLKEAGEWTAVSYSGNVYEYKPTKSASDVAKPKKRGRPPKPKVPKPAAKPRKKVRRRGEPSPVLLRSEYWINACQLMDSGNGTFTIKSLMEINGQTRHGAKNRVLTWKQAGLIVSDGNTPASYSRVLEKDSQQLSRN